MVGLRGGSEAGGGKGTTSETMGSASDPGVALFIGRGTSESYKRAVGGPLAVSVEARPWNHAFSLSYEFCGRTVCCCGPLRDPFRDPTLESRYFPVL